MKKEIRLNAFAMNCVAHQSPGLWTHPRDRTAEYNRLPYWIDLARTLERGRFDGLFLADVLAEQVNLSIPMKIICRSDCRGLCAHCGANWIKCMPVPSGIAMQLKTSKLARMKKLQWRPQAIE